MHWHLCAHARHEGHLAVGLGQANLTLQFAEVFALIRLHERDHLALGARRAESVRTYLVERGVNAGRIDTISYGKERPLEVCSEEACYAKNRRAVTVLSAGAGV